MGKIHLLFISLGIVFATTINSCNTHIRNANENDIEKKYDLGYFDKIELEGGYNVRLMQGDIPNLVLITSEENQDKCKIWTENGVLYVTTRSKTVVSDEIILNITIQDLKEINIEGGVFLTTKGYLNVEELDIKVQGGANLKMQLTAKHVKAKAEGGVNMEFEGVTDEFIASTEGAGNIDADNFKAKRVNCRVTGVGNASVYATEELEASVEGLGKISYRGDPSINKQVNGIGLIYKK